MQTLNGSFCWPLSIVSALAALGLDGAFFVGDFLTGSDSLMWRMKREMSMDETHGSFGSFLCSSSYLAFSTKYFSYTLSCRVHSNASRHLGSLELFFKRQLVRRGQRAPDLRVSVVDSRRFKLTSPALVATSVTLMPGFSDCDRVSIDCVSVLHMP